LDTSEAENMLYNLVRNMPLALHLMAWGTEFPPPYENMLRQGGD
jgi:hypothetical protein